MFRIEMYKYVEINVKINKFCKINVHDALTNLTLLYNITKHCLHSYVYVRVL